METTRRTGTNMRQAGRLLISIAFAGIAGIGAASAAPVSAPGHAPVSFDPVQSVQYVCDQFRCLDPRTGAYTQSACGRNGCRPSSGIVGYIDVPGARGRGPGPRYRDRWDDDWDDRPRRRGGGSRFDCNQLRCIELSSGRVWESACDRRGCRPTRPARGQGRYVW